MLCLEKPLGSLSSSPPAEKHVRLGWATETRKGPNNPDKAEHVLASSDLFESMKVPYHPPCSAEEVADTSSPA